MAEISKETTSPESADRKITKKVFLAIRGSANKEDWKTNLQAWKTVQTYGLMHAGWFSRTSHLPTAYLLSLLLEGCEIYVSGHSLGGAVAQLVTVRLLQELTFHVNCSEITSRIHCITFASPLVMTGTAVENLRRNYNDNFSHFIHPNDIVPKMFRVLHEMLDSLVAKEQQLNGSKQNARDTTSAKDAVLNCFQSIADYIQTICCTAQDDLLTAGNFISALKMVVSATKPVLKNDFVSDLTYKYKPFGNYYSVRGINFRKRLSNDYVNNFLKGPCRFSADLIVAHSLVGSYGGNLFPQLNQTIELYQHIQLPEFDTPEIKIRRAAFMQGAGNEYYLKVYGENLFAVQKISTIINDRTIDVNIEPYHIGQDCLMFPVIAISSSIFGFSSSENDIARKNYASLNFQIQNFFCPESPRQEFNRVFTFVEKLHPFDDCSLQELIMAALYILIFENLGGAPVGNGLTGLNSLRVLLEEILNAVPAEEYIRFNNPIGMWIMSDPDLRAAFWSSSNQIKEKTEIKRIMFLLFISFIYSN
jgi:hypothetical protein